MKIGMWELVLIVVVALVVIGPDKLPEYARMAGKWLRQLRTYTDAATKEVKEVTEPLKEITEPLKEITDPLNAIKQDLTNSVTDVTKSINDIGKEPTKAEAARKAAAEEEELVELDEPAAAADAQEAAAAAIDAIGTAPAEEKPEAPAAKAEEPANV